MMSNVYKTKIKENIKRVLGTLLIIFRPSPKIKYSRFGYYPTGYLRQDLVNSFFGTQNLYKHYQAKKIISALNLNAKDKILDFGCGSGYISIEIAKVSSYVLGVDINPDIQQIPIPEFLNGKLEFKAAESVKLLEEYRSAFDKILLSEVILSVEKPRELLDLCDALLKPGGSIVIVNGLGKFYIRDKVYGNPFHLKWCRNFNPKIPKDYEAYEKMLCLQFGNSANKFMEKKDIVELLSRHQYSLSDETYAPKKGIANILELRQLLTSGTGKTSMGFFSFLGYRLLFALINLLQKSNCNSGFIGVFVRK